jgi:hypothetical protein
MPFLAADFLPHGFQLIHPPLGTIFVLPQIESSADPMGVSV